MMPFYQNFSVLGRRNVLKYVSRIQLSRSNYAFQAKLRERATMMFIKDCAFKRYWVKTVSLCQWRTKEQSLVVCRR